MNDSKQGNELAKNSFTAAQHSAYYDKFWRNYGRDIAHVDRLRVDFLTDSIREFVGSNDLQILDLGCGRGWMAPFLSQFGKVTGVDFSHSGIQFAREHYGQYASFVLADPNLQKLGLSEDSRFDVVVCSEVLEHVHDQLSLLSLIRGFLHLDGWCMLTTPNGNIWSEFVRKTSPQELQPIENWVTRNRLASLLHDAGFRMLRHEGRVVYRLSDMGRATQMYRIFERFLKTIGLQQFYGRRILPIALYQMVVAQVAR